MCAQPLNIKSFYHGPSSNHQKYYISGKFWKIVPSATQALSYITYIATDTMPNLVWHKFCITLPLRCNMPNNKVLFIRKVCSEFCEKCPPCNNTIQDNFVVGKLVINWWIWTEDFTFLSPRWWLSFIPA